MPLWSEADDDLLKKFYAEGLSAGRIAMRFDDGRSRNAIIGRLSRMGLVGRASTSKISTGKRRSLPIKPTRLQDRGRTTKKPGVLALIGVKISVEKPKPEFEAIIKAPDPLPEPEPVVGGIDLLDLLPKHCRWPVTRDLPHRFCGANKVEGKPYCSHHCAIAYPSARKYRTPLVSQRMMAA